MKKLIALLLAVCVLTVTFVACDDKSGNVAKSENWAENPSDSQSGSSSDSQGNDVNSLQFELNESGSGYTVKGIGSCQDTEMVIPESYNGKEVTGIGDNAFYDCDSLTSVMLPDSITSIGYNAFFDCDNLTMVTIGNGVKSIGDTAFSSCENLTSVRIGSGVTSIGSFAFSRCYSLTSITIPNSVMSIGYRAFEECERLSTITVGNSVTSIGEYAFDSCYRLAEIINNSELNITVGGGGNGGIGAYAIEVHKGDSKIVDKDGYLFYTYGGVNYLFGYVGDDTSLVLPNEYNGGNYELYNYAFSDCDNLTSVTIPDSVETIGISTFRGCDSLVSITIGKGITGIGYGAFRDCYKLVEVINKSDLNITAESASNGYVGYYAKEVDSVESKIVNKDDYLFYAFNGVNYLLGYTGTKTELVLPENYNGENYEIYDYAFYFNDSLTSVTISDGVTSIGVSAFEENECLSNLTIGNGVTSVGSRAFFSCDFLDSLTMSNGVSSIGEYAFSACGKLKIINYSGTTTQWEKITKGTDWIYDYTVTCTDGTLTKSES